MEEGRKRYFSKLSDSEKEKLTYKDFLVSEIKEILNETCLSKIDRKIATYRFIDCMTLEEIAALTNYEIKTIQTHLNKIHKEFTKTFLKFFQKNS